MVAYSMRPCSKLNEKCTLLEGDLVCLENIRLWMVMEIKEHWVRESLIYTTVILECLGTGKVEEVDWAGCIKV